MRQPDGHDKRVTTPFNGTPPVLPPWLICIILSAWIVLGLLPRILAAPADAEIASVAGTIGDSFGLATSFFSSITLIFIVWSLRLQQRESAEQARLMKEAASLTAINHIYVHYSGGYGEGSEYGVLASIAGGHRRWAVRESFDSIDSLFARDRIVQVLNECRELASSLKCPVAAPNYMRHVGKLVASALVDSRAPASFRRALWPLYELIRASPRELCEGGNDSFARFELLAREAVTAWELKAGEEITALNS